MHIVVIIFTTTLPYTYVILICVIELQDVLMCSCVDLKQCSDFIYRNGLWFKLYNMGLNGKLLRVIRNMQQAVKSCVKLCDNYSNLFYLSIKLNTCLNDAHKCTVNWFSEVKHLLSIYVFIVWENRVTITTTNVFI